MAILIVDQQLGFVYWLGRALDAAGYTALPARSVEDAASLVGELGLEVDVLIMNPSTVPAKALQQVLNGPCAGSKVIALGDREATPPEIGALVDAYATRQMVANQSSAVEWIELVEGLLSLEPVARLMN